MFRLIKIHNYDGGFWFRIYGIGLNVQDRNKHPELFSERNGYTKCLRIGKWSIRFLKVIN